MKTDIIQEIKENLKQFLMKYSHAFNISSIHILIEEYLIQKYLDTHKIYYYDIVISKSNLKITILTILGKYDIIEINIVKILRKQKLKKIYESSL